MIFEKEVIVDGLPATLISRSEVHEPVNLVAMELSGKRYAFESGNTEHKQYVEPHFPTIVDFGEVVDNYGWIYQSTLINDEALESNLKRNYHEDNLVVCKCLHFKKGGGTKPKIHIPDIQVIGLSRMLMCEVCLPKATSLIEFTKTHYRKSAEGLYHLISLDGETAFTTNGHMLDHCNVELHTSDQQYLEQHISVRIMSGFTPFEESAQAKFKGEQEILGELIYDGASTYRIDKDTVYQHTVVNVGDDYLYTKYSDVKYIVDVVGLKHDEITEVINHLRIGTASMLGTTEITAARDGMPEGEYTGITVNIDRLRDEMALTTDSE